MLSRAASMSCVLTIALSTIALSTIALGLAGCDAPPPAASPAPAPSGAAQAPPDIDKPPLGQLPDTAAPLRYRIALEVDPDAPRFRGEATIDIELKTATRHLWMHGRDLDIEQVTLTDTDGTVVLGADAFAQRTDDGVALLELDRERQPGELTLGFRYTAAFNPELTGLYRVRAGDRWYAVTQFEDIGARQTFPSFDEPRFKTPYDIHITAPAAMVVAGNMPPISETVNDQNKDVVFATTPKLPTYLVALIVGPYDVVAAPDIPPSKWREKAIPLRGFAVAGSGSELEGALAGAAPLVLEHERYYGIAYPFEKLDLAAIPDFQAGAMENVGLITFRDSALLLGKAPTVEQRRVVTLYESHEIAHQWFGNLVTPRWWDDIWLNESFASWAGARAATALDPQAGYRTDELAGTLRAMDQDSLASARRLREPVATSGDIANAFDGITYSKGAGVLRMFEGYIGAERFESAVHQHLDRFRFGTAAAADFVDSLSSASGDDAVGTAFRSFLDQPGVPLVNTEVDCAGSDARLSLTTQRYLPLGSIADPVSSWVVPFCVRYGTEDGPRDACMPLVSGEQTMKLDQCPTWVLPNRGGDGYYRFALDASGLAKLLAAYPSIDPDEQVVVADAIASGFAAGRVEVAELLAALPTIAATKSPYAVSRILEPLRWLHSHAEGAARTALEATLRNTFAARRNALVANAATPLEEVLRNDLTAFLALYGGDAALRAELSSRALTQLANLKTNPAAPHWDLLATGARIALETGRLSPRDLVLSLTSTERSDVREALLKALGSAATADATSAARELVVSEKLKTNEPIDLLAAMFAPESAEQNWDWLKKNADSWSASVTELDRQWVPLFAGKLCRSDALPDVETFFRDTLEATRGTERRLRQALESIQICAATLARHDEAITALGGAAP